MSDMTPAPTSVLASRLFDSSQAMGEIDPVTIRPTLDRVIIEDVPDKEQEGLIFIPRNAAERGVGNNGLLRIGIVIGVGLGDKWLERVDKNETIRTELAEGMERLDMECKPGDRVIYSRMRHFEFHYGGKRLSIVNEQQSILAILGPEEPT